MNSESLHHARWTAALLLAALAAGCALRGGVAGPHVDPELDAVWPAPPEAPRVRLLQIVDEPSDLMGSAGLWEDLRDLVAGARIERLANPSAVAVDSERGLLVVADPGIPGVHLFDWANGRYRLLQGDEAHPLSSPVGVALTPDGTICVSESARGAITLLSPEGEVLSEIHDPERLQRPAGIVFDSDTGELIVVDVMAHAVVRCSLAGDIREFAGGHGTAPGEFNFPTHLWRMADGRLVVTDSLNFRVQVLSPEGEPLAAIGTLGDAPGCLARPKGVAADSAGNLWVVDTQFENIQAFSGEGQLLLHIGGSGHAPGQMWLPSGLAIDSQDRLYVADTHNHRVQIFQILPGPEVTP